MRAFLLCAGLAAALPRRRAKAFIKRGGSATPAPIRAALPTVAEAESAHAWTATDTVTRFAAKPDAGLSEAEVTRRREVAGRNVLVQAAKRTQWQMLLDQFDDRLVQILVRSRRPVAVGHASRGGRDGLSISAMKWVVS